MSPLVPAVRQLRSGIDTRSQADERANSDHGSYERPAGSVSQEPGPHGEPSYEGDRRGGGCNGRANGARGDA